MTDFASIVTKHVEACVAELREAVRIAMLEALQPEIAPEPKPARRRKKRSPPRRKPQERAQRVARPSREPERQTRATGKPAAKAGRPCGCAATGRHRRDCSAGSAPEQIPAPTADASRVRVPTDPVREARFAKLEESAARRTGTMPTPRTSARF